jgi:hypothetical protein
MKHTLELHDETPLKWPEDRPRTRFQDRALQAAWKLSYADTLKGLERELGLLKATYALVTHNQSGHETAGLGSKGYGCFFLGRSVNAHRVSYEWEKGPIPDGMQPDHLCRVKRCVRPSHLEAVSPRENLMRGDTLAAANILKTHCPQGHPYAGNNLKFDENRGIRSCRICCNARTNNWKRRVGYKVNRRSRALS